MRAALDGRMLRSQARPAAASAHCHNECTSAQPSACVAVIPLPPASIHFHLVYVALENPAVSTDPLYRPTPFRRAAICLTSEDGELFARLHARSGLQTCVAGRFAAGTPHARHRPEAVAAGGSGRRVRPTRARPSDSP